MAEHSPGDWPANQGKSLLPVEWSSPWQRLRRNLANDLPAVAAALGLKWQELWRRNREGDLSVPGFWPAALSALFWPAVVVLLLALPVAVGVGLRWSQADQAAPAAVGQREPPKLTPEQAIPADPLPLLPLEPPASEAALGHEPPAPELEPEAAQAPTEANAERDSLLKLLQADVESQWLTAVEVRSNRNQLQLVLGDGFLELPIERRQQQADQWLDQIQQLGYDSLELVSARGALLGRSAQLGSGMILWNAPIP